MSSSLNASAMRSAVERVLLGVPGVCPAIPNPDVVDIIDLYLFLPTEITVGDGRRFEIRSALTSLLAESNEITGRDGDGDVIDETKLGALLGAVGYLALIDQVGKAVRWADRPVIAKTAFERILLQHGRSVEDAVALYALRNALVHSFGLSNRSKDRPELQRTFVLASVGLLVEHPRLPWSGDPNDVTDQETVVSLDALGRLANSLVFELRESWIDDRSLELTSKNTTAQMRRDYLYTREISSAGQ